MGVSVGPMYILSGLDKRNVSQKARQAIIDQHEEQHDGDADYAGLNTGLNRKLA